MNNIEDYDLYKNVDVIFQHVGKTHKLRLCENLSENSPLLPNHTQPPPPPPPYPSYYPALPFSFPIGLRAAFPSPLMESYLHLAEQRLPHENPEPRKPLIKEEEERPMKPQQSQRPRVFQPFLDSEKEPSVTSERSRSAELSTGSFEPDLEEEGMMMEENMAEDLTVKKKEEDEELVEEKEEEGVTSTSLDSIDMLRAHLKMNKLPAMEPSAMKALMEKGRLDALLNPEVRHKQLH